MLRMKSALAGLVQSGDVTLMSQQIFRNANLASRLQYKDSLAQISCVSHKFMHMNGLIQHAGASGLFAQSPELTRSLEKLCKILDNHMRRLPGGVAQKMALPVLCPHSLWKESGRNEILKSELLVLQDRTKNEFCLSPTFEELVTNLVSKCNLTSSQLPVALYQVGPKFRDEPRPKNGLLRSREFIMKDMYSFHSDLDNCSRFYDDVRQAYRLFFDEIGFSEVLVEVKAPSGAMGGHLSHEFHLLAEVGEDTLMKCSDCSTFFHPEVESSCPSCGSSSTPSSHQSIELGHTFILGDKYSSIFGCTFPGDFKGQEIPMQMGCYGLGLTRIVSAAMEQSGADELHDLVWPANLSPYKVCLVLPKNGSKEEAKAAGMINYLVDVNRSVNDVVVDDRTSSTIGRRLKDIQMAGYPYVVVFGRSLLDEDVPKVELIDRLSNETKLLGKEELVKTLTSLHCCC